MWGAILATVLAALSLTLPVSAQVPTGNASLTAPAHTRPGTELAVSVDEFTPGAEVQLILLGPGPSAYLLPVLSGSAVADASGHARWTTRLPRVALPTAAAPDAWWLNADDAEGRFANLPLLLQADETVPPPLPSAVAPTSPPDLDVAPAPTAMPAEPLASVSSGPWPADVVQPGALLVVRDTTTSHTPVTWTLVPSVALRVRAEPSLKAPIVAAAPAGRSLRLLEGPHQTPDADFYRVELPGGAHGYVAPPTEDVPPPPRPVSVDLFRLRTGPSTSTAIRGVLRTGTAVTVLAVEPAGEDAWVRVSVRLPDRGETEGYLPATFLAPR